MRIKGISFLNSSESLRTFTDRKNVSSLITNLFLYSGATGFAQFLTAVYTMLLARWLMPEGYGVLAGCYAAATISSFLINWGMDTWLLHKASTDPAPLRLGGEVLKLKGFLGILWTGTLWFVLTRLRPGLYIPSVIALVLLDTWVDSAFLTLSSLLNATRRTRTVSILLVAGRTLRLVSAVALILIRANDLLPFTAVRLLFTIITFGAAVVIARPSWVGPAQTPIKKVWMQSLPYAGTDLLVAIYAQIDVFLISLLAGKVATGIYSPAVSLTNAFITLIGSAFGLFVPYLTLAYRNHPERLKRQFFEVTGLLLAVGSILTLILGLLGPWFIDLLLQPSYHASGQLLKIMSPILLFKSLSVVCAVLLVAVEQQRQRLLPQLISAGANFLFNLWAIPHWGPTGAAMVYLASEIILTAGYSIRVLIFFTKQSRQVGQV